MKRGRIVTKKFGELKEDQQWLVGKTMIDGRIQSIKINWRVIYNTVGSMKSFCGDNVNPLEVHIPGILVPYPVEEVALLFVQNIDDENDLTVLKVSQWDNAVRNKQVNNPDVIVNYEVHHNQITLEPTYAQVVIHGRKLLLSDNYLKSTMKKFVDRFEFEIRDGEESSDEMILALKLVHNQINDFVDNLV